MSNRPRICESCSAIIGRPRRHSVKRRCADVLKVWRYSQTPQGRAANVRAVKRWREKAKGSP